MTIYYLILDATHEHFLEIEEEFNNLHYESTRGGDLSVRMNNDNTKAEMKVSGDFSGWLPTELSTWADEPSVLQSC